MGGGDAPLVGSTVCSSSGSLERPPTFEALPKGLERALPSVRSGGHRGPPDDGGPFAGDVVLGEAWKAASYHSSTVRAGSGTWSGKRSMFS